MCAANHHRQKEIEFYRSALWQVLENGAFTSEDTDTLSSLEKYVFSDYDNPLLIEATLATLNQNISDFD